MSEEHQDTPGTPVTVSLDSAEPISAYIVSTAGGEQEGRAEFLESGMPGQARIFFHTEVDPASRGRGLGAILVRQALADSIRDGVPVVPVCALFARYLEQHGAEFLEAGGNYREPTAADIALLKQVTGRA